MLDRGELLLSEGVGGRVRVREAGITEEDSDVRGHAGTVADARGGCDRGAWYLWLIMRCGVLAGVLSLSLGLSGCSFGEVDLRGKRCPCAVGWVCDTPANRCVEEIAPGMDAGATPDGAADAGADARGIDAGGIDAPASDSGAPPDAAVGTVCAESVAASAYFCDGFEDGPGFAGWSRGTYEADGTASWTDEAYRGAGALRSQTTVETGRAAAASTFVPPIVDADLWLRAYYYFPSGWTMYHLDIGAVRTLTDPFQGIALALDSGELPYLYVDEESTAYRATAAAPRDEWICIELHVAVSDDLGSVELFVNGARVAQSPLDIDTLPPGGFGYLDVGVPYTDEGQDPATVMVDEVALGPSRIPCDP